MAAIAITIKNLLSSLIGSVIVAGSENTVVTTAASRKKSINIGNALFKLNVFSPLFSFLAVHIANTKVIGMIASVLVSFTIVAASRVLLPWIPSQAVAAAVTDEVSFTAVPAKRPKPSFESPRIPTRVGNISAAITLKRKITEID